MMLKNFLKIAYRNLRRQAGYTALNVMGLAVGLGCCFLIALFVRHELSYDQFHEDADEIYRVESDWRPAGGNISLASVNYPFVDVLKTEYPELEIATFTRAYANGAVRCGDEVFREEGILYANNALFDVFSFELEQGDEKTALSEPYTVVLTREMAEKYFGEENPIGQTLEFFGEFEAAVSGVLAPSAGPTHLPLKILISWPTLEAQEWWQLDAWGANNTFTYVRFPSSEAAATLEASFPNLIERHAGENWPGSELSLRPVTEIHLYSNHTGELAPGGNPDYVTIFAIVALFILFLAGVNFVNLSTARSLERAKEVGVRKTAGAARGQIARQFLAEAVLLAMLGLLVATALVALAASPLESLIGRSLIPGGKTLGVASLVAVGLTLVVGLGAGFYPAVALSRFQPAEVLRGRLVSGPGGRRLRQGLVVFQFTVAIVLLVGTFVVYHQLQHLRAADLGFDEEQVLAIHGPGASTSERLAFFETLRAETAIENAVSTAEAIPAELRGGTGIVLPGVSLEEDATTMVRTAYVSADFFETLGVSFLAGRDFRAGSAPDSASVILNEAAARQTIAQEAGRYASLAELVGETVNAGSSEMQVLGVVENFYLTSLHSPVEPMAFFLDDAGATYLVRTAAGAAEPALRAVEERWAEFFPEAPLEYRFTDESFDAAYRAEEQLGTLALLFSLLAILVACFGLFGLAAYAAERRTKEIGVRKVLGASAANIVALLSKDFLKLVAIAFAAAAPIAYWAMSRWLESFASRIELSPWLFAGAGVAVLLIALLTVSYQAMKAALMDPVKSLRYE